MQQRLAAWRRRQVDRAARRMHDRLAADPDSFRAGPRSVGALVLAVGVLGALLAAALGVGDLAVHARTGVAWVLVALGVLVLLVLVPRPGRLRGVVVLDRDAAPAVHALVDDLAARVGVRPPRVLGFDLHWNASVVPVGWVGRPALVVGLPLWAALPTQEGTAVLCHELGHLRGRDHLSGRVLWSARRVLERTEYLLTPTQAPSRGIYRGASVTWAQALSEVVLWVLCLPVVLAGLAFDRLVAPAEQHREYLADRRAAQVVGSRAMASALARSWPGRETVARSARLRGEDPFEALRSTRPGPLADPAAVAVREPHRADATHPPDDLRVSLLMATPGAVTSAVDTGLVHAADEELRSLERRSTKIFGDRLREG